jgi:hypothetical protein
MLKESTEAAQRIYVEDRSYRNTSQSREVKVT